MMTQPRSRSAMNSNGTTPISRRDWLERSWALSAIAALGSRPALAAAPAKAQVAITLDLEMSRNFPNWDDMHWDYQKGNLNPETIRYAVEAGRRVRERGGVIHYFCVGRVLEQEEVGWIADLAKAGHPIGNHTYDHVNVTAQNVKDLQFRFQRAPWLLRGQSVPDAIRENVWICRQAMHDRVGIADAGFRTPGGFADGLKNHPAVRGMLRELGYTWISSLYPPHPNTAPREKPSDEVLAGIVTAQRQAQPFRYPDGLIEIPMSPISDIGAFRTGRWQLEWFLEAIRRALAWVIEHGAVFDFLAHPSCLYVVDPQFRSIDLIGDMVRSAGDRAELVDLDTIARRLPRSAS